MVRSRRIRWTEHVAGGRGGETHTGKLNEKDHLEHLEVDGRITMWFDLTEMCLELWSGFIWPRTGTSARLL
jgi:hypothetical protein